MGRYLAISDVRGEGISEALYSDAIVQSRIDQVIDLAEHCTGTWWEARTKTYRVNGSGGRRQMLEQRVIALTSVTVDNVAQDLTGIDVDGALLTLHSGYFSVGDGNVVVVGSFGTVNLVAGTGGTYTAVIPPPVKRALIQWVINLLPELSDPDAASERRTATAVSSSVGGSSRTFAPASARMSGDPEVDAILRMYCRPPSAAVL